MDVEFRITSLKRLGVDVPKSLFQEDGELLFGMHNGVGNQAHTESNKISNMKACLPLISLPLGNSIAPMNILYQILE